MAKQDAIEVGKRTRTSNVWWTPRKYWVISKERHNERATSRKSDKSKTVSKERQEY